MRIGDHEIGTNISRFVSSHARFRGGETAFIVGERRVSGVELRTEEFPRNALGKLLKRELREPYWRSVGSPGRGDGGERA